MNVFKIQWRTFMIRYLNGSSRLFIHGLFLLIVEYIQANFLEKCFIKKKEHEPEHYLDC